MDSDAWIRDLEAENERLKAELERSCREKIKAAECGLAVLEEKQQLQQQCEDLEALYETTRHDLDCAKETLNKIQKTHKLVSEIGIHQEESLLMETASREAELLRNISDLELELRNARASLERLKTDCERSNSALAEMGLTTEQLEIQNQQMKKDIKELKFREVRNMSDYSELEDENINLQKQLSQAKQAQVDYEATKHENLRLKEYVEELNAEVDEVGMLKKIVEKNLEEALNLLQQEREQKHSLKRELDQRISSESMYNLQTLANLRLGDLKTDGNRNDRKDGDRDANKQAEAENEMVETEQQSTVGDLFTEIHVNELRKLEQLLDITELEKNNLQAKLADCEENLESYRSQVARQNEQILQMKAHLSAMASAMTNSSSKRVDEIEDTDDAAVERREQQELCYKAALVQIGELQERIEQMEKAEENANVNRQNENALKDEIARLQTKMCDNQTVTSDLENDLKHWLQLARESQGNLSTTQDQLVQVSEDLAQLYHLVCEVNGETPDRVMLDHVQGRRVKRLENPSGNENEGLSIGEELSNAIRNEDLCTGGDDKQLLDFKDPIACSKLVETINDQIKYLRNAVERSIEINRQKLKNGAGASEDAGELQGQIVRLKAMLSTKREQIATLRGILKANKATAEMALSTLKQKYESEKVVVTETMKRLHNELKSLKEEAVMFQSMRGMFAQRCDEYVTQMEEQRRQLEAAEDEKKTLNTLLRMAIQQKLVLTQRLEDLEFDRERRCLRQQRAVPKGKNDKVSDCGAIANGNSR